MPITMQNVRCAVRRPTGAFAHDGSFTPLDLFFTAAAHPLRIVQPAAPPPRRRRGRHADHSMTLRGVAALLAGASGRAQLAAARCRRGCAASPRPFGVVPERRNIT